MSEVHRRDSATRITMRTREMMGAKSSSSSCKERARRRSIFTAARAPAHHHRNERRRASMATKEEGLSPRHEKDEQQEARSGTGHEQDARLHHPFLVRSRGERALPHAQRVGRRRSSRSRGAARRRRQQAVGIVERVLWPRRCAAFGAVGSRLHLLHEPSTLIGAVRQPAKGAQHTKRPREPSSYSAAHPGLQWQAAAAAQRAGACERVRVRGTSPSVRAPRVGGQRRAGLSARRRRATGRVSDV